MYIVAMLILKKISPIGTCTGHIILYCDMRDLLTRNNVLQWQNWDVDEITLLQNENAKSQEYSSETEVT